jgi:CheY-like chemotaxis protein
MSNVHRVASQLPYLRRFARALSGGQLSGDASVLAMLQAVAGDPALLSADLNPNLATFRTYLKLWNSARLNHEMEQTSITAETAGSDCKLAAIRPRERQAYLLMAVEEFSAADVAVILETDEANVHALVDQATSELAAQLTTKVLIIEDEPMIAIDLANLVTSLGHEVCDTARTHDQAVAAFRRYYPGLVLSDVQLADGSSGLDAVNEILQSFDVPVIFITAYPELLLTGGRPEPTFLINKPFQTKAVQAVISQALFFGHKAYRTERPKRIGASAETI